MAISLALKYSTSVGFVPPSTHYDESSRFCINSKHDLKLFVQFSKCHILMWMNLESKCNKSIGKFSRIGNYAWIGIEVLQSISISASSFLLETRSTTSQCTYNFSYGNWQGIVRVTRILLQHRHSTASQHNAVVAVFLKIHLITWVNRSEYD